jgi:hypothetical protein
MSWLKEMALPAASGLVLCGFVAAMALGAATGPRPTTSAMDGRPLARFPELSAAGVESGSWMRGTEAWLDDHVPARQRWLELHAAITAGPMDNPVVDDVYLDDARDMQLQKPLRLRVPKQLAKDAGRLGADIRATGTPLLWVYVPRKEESFDDRLPPAWGSLRPSGAALRAAMAKSGPVVDLSPTLADPARRDSYYWRTAHHWTPAGALAGLGPVTAAAADLGVDIPADDRPMTPRSYGPFYGSTGRKATRGATSRPDDFAVPQPDAWRARICRGEDADRCSTPTFATKRATDPDPYANRYKAFLGGDLAYQRLENPDPAARGTIVMLKDSFGDALGTYLAERVKTLITIDERHYAGKEIKDLVADVDPDLVLVVHNQVTVLANPEFDSTAWVDVRRAVRARRAGGGDG